MLTTKEEKRLAAAQAKRSAAAKECPPTLATLTSQAAAAEKQVATADEALQKALAECAGVSEKRTKAKSSVQVLEKLVGQLKEREEAGLARFQEQTDGVEVERQKLVESLRERADAVTAAMAAKGERRAEEIKRKHELAGRVQTQLAQHGEREQAREAVLARVGARHAVLRREQELVAAETVAALASEQELAALAEQLAQAEVQLGEQLVGAERDIEALRQELVDSNAGFTAQKERLDEATASLDALRREHAALKARAARVDNKAVRATLRELEEQLAKVESQCERLEKTSALLRPTPAAGEEAQAGADAAAEPEKT